jgi:16S rRNA (guanine(966)-N(2))-methyltransferase RsmD
VRIIGGEFSGLILRPPKGLPVRPTTDKAKESLFNILGNHFNFEGLRILDLFAGTGNMSAEFCSRGAGEVVSVDAAHGCVSFMKETSAKLGTGCWKIVRQDVFRFLSSEAGYYDIIFADAPYANRKLRDIPGLVWEKDLLATGGWLIVEHEASLDLSMESGYFDRRAYGQSAFSFFRKPEQT